jgi:ABC-type nickel/cobalt efflux system permease component RcnA
MGSLTDLLQPGAAADWLLLPSALVLGVLHGLEPGHSKIMMTAFIIAVRGTAAQAVLLGLAATKQNFAKCRTASTNSSRSRSTESHGPPSRADAIPIHVLA